MWGTPPSQKIMSVSHHKKFTLKQLALYDGKDGSPAYIAYKGKIYDVSDSFLWKNGKHQVFHQAGRDLTGAMDEAPHGEDLMERVPIIGELCDE